MIISYTYIHITRYAYQPWSSVATNPVVNNMGSSVNIVWMKRNAPRNFNHFSSKSLSSTGCMNIQGLCVCVCVCVYVCVCVRYRTCVSVHIQWLTCMCVHISTRTFAPGCMQSVSLHAYTATTKAKDKTKCTQNVLLTCPPKLKLQEDAAKRHSSSRDRHKAPWCSNLRAQARFPPSAATYLRSWDIQTGESLTRCYSKRSETSKFWANSEQKRASIRI